MKRQTFITLTVLIMLLLAWMLWLATLPVNPKLPKWLYPWGSQPNQAGHQSLGQVVSSPNKEGRR